MVKKGDAHIKAFSGLYRVI